MALRTPSCTVMVRWCLSMSGCSRRITSGGAMHGPLCAFTITGFSTPAITPAGSASAAMQRERGEQSHSPSPIWM